MAEELFGGQDVGATPSYKEQAYRLIKEAILFNRFRVGAIYSQDDICKELGISRTPVREALLELQKDGYVSFSRGKGVQVVPVSDRDARDILETRMYIECINAKLAANRAAQRDLQAMRESLDRLRDQLSTRDGQHLYRLDHIFHRAVAAATQNRLLYRECDLRCHRGRERRAGRAGHGPTPDQLLPPHRQPFLGGIVEENMDGRVPGGCGRLTCLNM